MRRSFLFTRVGRSEVATTTNMLKKNGEHQFQLAHGREKEQSYPVPGYTTAGGQEGAFKIFSSSCSF